MLFEANFKQPTAKLRAIEDVLPMLTPYSTDAIRDRITLIYRGYDLELTRAPSGWLVGMYPRSADLPILPRSDFFARNEDGAIVQSKKRIDWVLLS